MLKFPITQPINNVYGKQLQNQDGESTVGSMLLKLLSQSQKVTKLEAFYIPQVAMKISDGLDKKEDIELNEKHFNFLKRIVDQNRVLIGDREYEFFIPFAYGQMMVVFGIEPKEGEPIPEGK